MDSTSSTSVSSHTTHDLSLTIHLPQYFWYSLFDAPQVSKYVWRLQWLFEKRRRGVGHKIQADALNDDISVTAICDVHTSLKSRFHPHPTPHRCPFLVFRYFDFHEASCLARNEETGTKRAERKGLLSSHRLSDTVRATHSVIFAKCNSQHISYRIRQKHTQPASLQRFF
jgi:hypothetical protein